MEVLLLETALSQMVSTMNGPVIFPFSDVTGIILGQLLDELPQDLPVNAVQGFLEIQGNHA